MQRNRDVTQCGKIEYMVLQNSLYLYLSIQNALNMGIQGASVRFFILLYFPLLFGILIGILMALKVEKRRDIKGY